MNGAHKPGLHAFAVFTACCTFLLVIAGALVTSNDAGLSVPDWPLSYGSLMPPMVGGIRLEHGHRMVATAVGMLTIALVVWLARREERRWVRRLGWLTLAAVVAQGILGGLTVKFLLPRPVSVAHATLAQLFFCTTVSLAVFTSPWWRREIPRREERAGAGKLVVAAFAAILTQLVLGAAVRHRWMGILPHLVWAGAAAGIVLATRQAIRKRNIPEVRRPANLLAALVGIQLLVGGGTYWTRMAYREAPQPMPVMVGFTVAHVALGALALAASVVLALGYFRVVRAGEHDAAVELAGWQESRS